MLTTELRFRLIAFGVLAALVWFAYGPSLSHVARSDQIAYLADIHGEDSLMKLTLGSSSFTRTRHFSPGDFLLYRPVIYWILGFEYWLWGYHFEAWQLVGILLHLGVVWTVFCILRKFQLRRAAFALSACLAVLTAGIELVTWHHLHGYLIFLLFFLGSFFGLFDHVESGQTRGTSLLLVAFLLFAACLTHELGCLWAIIFAAFLWLTHPSIHAPLAKKPAALPRSTAFLLLVPVLLYAILSFYDYHRHAFSPQNEVSFHFSWIEFGINYLKSLAWWICMGIFSVPSEWTSSPLEGTKFIPSAIVLRPLFPLVFAAVAVVIPYWIFRQIRASPQSSPWKKWRILIILLLGAYVALLDFGRFMPRSLGYIFRNLNCAYFVWLLLVLFAGCWLTEMKTRRKCIRYPIQNAIYGIIALWIVWNAFQLRELNQKRAQMDRPLREMLSQTSSLVAAHHADPGFCFYVPPLGIFEPTQGLAKTRRSTGKSVHARGAYFFTILFRGSSAIHLERKPLG